MGDAALAALGHSVLTYLAGSDRFRLATLLRHERHQALALYSIPSATLVTASQRGRVDLLDFRLRTATTAIGSVPPIDSLFWILKSRTTPSPDRRPTSPARIEWWDLALGFEDNVSYSRIVVAALHGAAKGNHVGVLEWWTTSRASQTLLLHAEVNIGHVAGAALMGGGLEVLKWCKSRGWDPRTAEYWPLRMAATFDRAEALAWVEAEAGGEGSEVARQILGFDYSDDELQLAQLRRRVAAGAASGPPSVDVFGMLQQIIESKFDRSAPGSTFAAADGPAARPDLREAAKHAAVNCQISVLDWIRSESGGDFDVGSVVSAATESGHVAVLNWWKSRYPWDPFRPPRNSIWTACFRGHVGALQFWWDVCAANSDVWQDASLEAAAKAGFGPVFEWWATRFPEPPNAARSSILVRKAVEGEHVDLLHWFQASGYVQPLECPVSVAASAPTVFSWWTRSGLPLTNDIADGFAFVKRHALNREVMDWLLSTRDADGEGSWACIPTEDDWPALDLIELAASIESNCLSPSAWREEILDGLDWWLERGSVLGGGRIAEVHSRRLVEECLPFLEWLVARNLGIPVFADNAPEDIRSKRWWEEARRRLPASRFVDIVDESSESKMIYVSAAAAAAVVAAAPTVLFWLYISLLCVARSTAAPASATQVDIYSEQGITECQFELIVKITSVFENSSPKLNYASCGNHNDDHGLSCGIIQFTTRTGSVRDVIVRYLTGTTQKSPPLASFVPALTTLATADSASEDGLTGFCSAWQDAALHDASAFEPAQKYVAVSRYFAPNAKLIKTVGIQTALGVAIVFDTVVQLGPISMATLAERAKPWVNGGGSTEEAFLRRLLAARREMTLGMPAPYQVTVYRVNAYEHILNMNNTGFKDNAVETLNNDGKPVAIDVKNDGCSSVPPAFQVVPLRWR
ncbi:hypothetical protein DFJ73DRAFT_792554 [Zopfochytrium polystomum]|nr:hypothetical protein DFJ73DRAFT_792554 [Zopfochytrium polystomum]